MNIIEKQKKKLLYRSCYRGCKETDLILGSFTKKFINELSKNELDDLEDILNESDDLLYKWITGKMPLPTKYSSMPIMLKIIHYNIHNF
jgi:antitoxin CptB